jgi:hypothetical protein
VINAYIRRICLTDDAVIIVVLMTSLPIYSSTNVMPFQCHWTGWTIPENSNLQVAASLFTPLSVSLHIRPGYKCSTRTRNLSLITSLITLQLVREMTCKVMMMELLSEREFTPNIKHAPVSPFPITSRMVRLVPNHTEENSSVDMAGCRSHPCPRLHIHFRDLPSQLTFDGRTMYGCHHQLTDVILVGLL